MSDIISVQDLNLWYGNHQALHHINMEIPEKSSTPFTRSFMRFSVFNRVDFPQPEGPIKAVILFSGISILIWCSA